MSKIEEIFKKQSLASSFFLFLRKPNYITRPNKNIKVNLWSVFQLWSLAILIVILIGGPLNWVVGISGYDDGQNLVWEFLQGPWVYVFLAAAFLGPIMEEVSFRLFLRPRPFNLSLGFFTILFIVLFEIFGDRLLSSLNLSLLNPFLILFIIFSFITCLAFLGAKIIKAKFNLSKIENFYVKKFPVIFYSASLLFAILHISNYYNLENHLGIVILLIAPQIILSFFLGYIRMAFGFLWSILFHVFHNGLLVSPIIMKGLLSDKAKSALFEEGIGSADVAIERADNFIILFFIIFYLFVVVLFFVALFKVFSNNNESVLSDNPSKNASKTSLD